MKTKEQVQAECFGDVYTLDEFIDEIERGCINQFDGIGYFHDGENEIKEVNIWDRSLTYEDICNYLYVCWYNK